MGFQILVALEFVPKNEVARITRWETVYKLLRTEYLRSTYLSYRALSAAYLDAPFTYYVVGP